MTSYHRQVGSYFRPFADVDEPGSICVALMESIMVMKSSYEPGNGVQPHAHSVDQFLFMLDGQLTVQIGQSTYSIREGDLICIPKNLFHCNVNEGDVREHHIEIVGPTRTDWTRFGDMDDESPPDGYKVVRRVEDQTSTAANAPTTGMAQHVLIDRASGSDYGRISVLDLAGDYAERTHIHSHDEFSFVIQGEVEAAVAARQMACGERTLVIAPAGVPHRLSAGADKAARVLRYEMPERGGGDSGMEVDFAVDDSVAAASEAAGE
jgi:quercetin dioxygenase-like cupin family protein